jgi:PPOX class probable F420-dependent enzyme
MTDFLTQITMPLSSITPVIIPHSHRDLLLRPVHGVLSTLMPDGQPQSSLVWVDYDGLDVLINTTLERQKCQNILNNPKVSLLVVDPENTSRYIEIRGQVAEITTNRAITHADRLTQRYTNKKYFYGDIYPVGRQYQETRVIVKIRPSKVTLDAYFNQDRSG